MDVRIPETPSPLVRKSITPPLPLSADVFYEQPLTLFKQSLILTFKLNVIILVLIIAQYRLL